VGELQSATDALEVLDADDLFALGAAGVLYGTSELVTARNRIGALLARTVRVGDVRSTTGCRPCGPGCAACPSLAAVIAQIVGNVARWSTCL
jgi:hypothetical protein